MLSNPTSAIEARRRSHRRQNSTPNIEVGQLRRGPTSATMNGPASGGIQRANSHRVGGGHRRGLSLDQPRLITSSKMTPTLGPISQDDISVSNHTNNIGGSISPNPGQFQNNRNTVVAQASLAQPGQGSLQGNLEHGQFHHPSVYSSPLALQAIQQFESAAAMMPHHQHHHSLSHPHSPVGFAGLTSPHASPTQHPNPFTPGAMPHAPLTSGPQFNTQAPTLQQIEDLNKHIKSVYGMMGEVHINILPTPVATPQKRPGPIPTGVEKVDVAGNMAMKFDNSDLTLDPSLVGAAGDFKLHNLGSPSSERDYASSFYNSSPSHSVSCSPQQQNIKSFLDIASATNPLVFSSQTSLVDVEAVLAPTNGTNSPSRLSPRPVSIADLSIDGTIEDTGISEAEIQQYISAQDLNSHRWTCLYPGCDAKTFGRRENIRSHVQTHLGDRQFRCNHCGKCFVRQHDLKRHAKIHSGNKPYKCPCGGGFARQDALTRHRQRGMCIGGFPNAVRKQARRGRPKKVRNEAFGERLEKELLRRERADSLSSDAGSGAEDSPSPRGLGDSARLMDLPEDDEIDTFGLAPSPPPSGMDNSYNNDELDDTLDSTNNDSRQYHQHNLINPASLAFTPPASSPAEMDLSSHSLHLSHGHNSINHHHHHPHHGHAYRHSIHSIQSLHSPTFNITPRPGSSSDRPRTPSLEPSSTSTNIARTTNTNRNSLISPEAATLALNTTPPTSPLLCASSATTASSSIISAGGPPDMSSLLTSFDALNDESTVLIHGHAGPEGDTSGMDVDAMGISFSGSVGCGTSADCVDPVLSDPFGTGLGGLGEFLKGEVAGNGEFGLWDI